MFVFLHSGSLMSSLVTFRPGPVHVWHLYLQCAPHSFFFCTKSWWPVTFSSHGGHVMWIATVPADPEGRKWQSLATGILCLHKPEIRNHNPHSTPERWSAQSHAVRWEANRVQEQVGWLCASWCLAYGTRLPPQTNAHTWKKVVLRLVYSTRVSEATQEPQDQRSIVTFTF